MSVHAPQALNGLGPGVEYFLLSVGLGVLFDQGAKRYLLARDRANKARARNVSEPKS
jgi:hypothetical protein